ncbi:hypothetical protein ACFQ3J_20440 [Paenibacillus provencensis]|uniref:Uncharacterized protein n=1 Tax=Paenibacillus provencensis TaxID=441151 RepID=A0ABW3PZD1_9BACL|nr:hypothetical protein [Paenibacillus sp. MER 78]MCM3129494.1 hypothetical protein [Paenibacillus sp. MER 78]
MKDSSELERQLSEMLTEGEPEFGDRKERERQNMSPKHEIRIQTQLDPIVEETKKFRRIAKEVDHRYDAYMKKAGLSEKGSDEE